MANNTKPMEQWNLNDFVEYYTGSHRLFGNSKEFKNITALALNLQMIDNEHISNDMVYDRTKKLEELIGATFEYYNSHLEAHTSTGKERLDVANAFMKFCQKEKEFTEFRPGVKFFEGKTLDEMRKGVNFKELGRLYKDLEQWTSQPMDEHNVIHYTNALNKAVQASEFFLKYQPEGTVMHPIKEREEVQKLVDEYKPCLDSMRDLRTVRQLISEGKGWEDLHQLKTATATYEGRVEITGANVSRRMKMHYNGKEGFFTEENFVMSFEETLEDYADTHYNTREEKLAAAHISVIKDLRCPIDELYKLEMPTLRKLETCRFWDQMPESKQKQDLFEILSSKDDFENLQTIWSAYSKKTADNKTDSKIAFETAITENNKISPRHRNLYLANANMFMDLMNREVAEVTKGITPLFVKLEEKLYEKLVNDTLDMKSRDSKLASNAKESYQTTRELMGNPKAMAETVNLWKHAQSQQIGYGNAKIDIKDVGELTRRNVATSRLAELLGIGNLIAHSEKMTVTINGRQVSGSFMEFAEGMDITKANDRSQLKAISETDHRLVGNLAKDSSNLKLFDVICAQTDRHMANFFTKISEAGADGKRSITGIQGIDNDMSFSREVDIKKSRTGELQDLIFADADFMERLNSLTRDQLEYAVGDLLTTNEIDAIIGRAERVKKHIKEKGILLKGDQWKLDEYSIDSEVDEHDAYGKKYVNALKDIQQSEKGKYVWDIERHNQGKVADSIRDAEARYDRMIQEETELYGSVSSMFEQAEAEAKAKSTAVREEEKAKRAATFDRILAGKDMTSKSQPAKTEVKAKKSVVLTSVKELAEPQRASDRGIRFGAAREKAAAKKNVNPPIIGSHRKK